MLHMKSKAVHDILHKQQAYERMSITYVPACSAQEFYVVQAAKYYTLLIMMANSNRGNNTLSNNHLTFVSVFKYCRGQL